MKDLVISLIFGVIIYCVYLVIVFMRKKGLNNFLKSSEATYILAKYDIKLSLIDSRKFAYDIIIANTLILFVILFVIGFVDSIYLQILVGFALALPMIYLGYNLIGDKYKKSALLKEEETKTTKKEEEKETKKPSKKTIKKNTSSKRK